MKNELIKIKAEIKQYLKNFWEILIRPEMAILPGQLAFFLALSIIPTITLVAFLATKFDLNMDIMYSFVAKMFNSDVASIIVPTLTDAPGFKFVLYFAISYYIASNGTASIIVTSNTIYNVKNKNYFYRRFKAIGMQIMLVLLVLFILIIPVFGTKIIGLLGYINLAPKIINRITLTINLLKGPISWFIMFILIRFIYQIAPDRKMYSTTLNYGAIFSTIGIIVITSIYSFYINNIANYNAFYGGAANIIILLLWLYFLSYVFVIGMALNQRKEYLDIETNFKTKPLEEIKKEEELERTKEIEEKIVETVKSKMAKNSTNKNKKISKNK